MLIETKGAKLLHSCHLVILYLCTCMYQLSSVAYLEGGRGAKAPPPKNKNDFAGTLSSVGKFGLLGLGKVVNCNRTNVAINFAVLTY